jgi:hypothetical protein
MPRLDFTAFYPSRPFWAVTKVNFQVPKVEGWFHDQMAEEVYTTDTDAFALRICRDGRILLRVAALESADRTEQVPPPIETTVRRWGEYLNFLNGFYLLLDSASIEVDRVGHFNLDEITHRDAFRVTYEDGKLTGESIATESIASVFQMARYSSSYRNEFPIEYDHRILARQVVSLAAIEQAASQFKHVVENPGTERPLASFAKSLAEYKVGNYATSIVLAWFITEATLSTLWRRHLESLNYPLDGGRRRINRDRRDFLTGRDFTTSIVSNMLELSNILSASEFDEIDSVRGYRNKIVHSHTFSPGPAEAQLALKIAQEMIQRLWGVSFTPNLGYSVTGL